MFVSFSTKIAEISHTHFSKATLGANVERIRNPGWSQFRHRTVSAIDRGSSLPSSHQVGRSSSRMAFEEASGGKPTRKRSFLLDPPSKPPRKRTSASRVLPSNASPFERRIASNPYANILATPLRQCLLSRKSLPNAFLTKLIQASPELQGDRAWIVPEKIIPEKLLSKSNPNMDSSRSGLGKWIYSGSKTVEAMVKEGKYKMINSSAYMRPDMARLIYAQWTIRVAYDAMQLGNGGSKKSYIITLTNPTPRDQSEDGAVDDIAVYNSPGNKRLQCVLYFGESDKTVASSGGGESKDTEAELTSHQNSSAPIDITRPKLPSFMSRSRVISYVKIRCKDGTTFKAPLYDMGQLFNNHPQGLEVIRKSFSVDISPKENSASSCQWLGLVESEKTLPVAIGLWKLVSILSKSESK